MGLVVYVDVVGIVVVWMGLVFLGVEVDVVDLVGGVFVVVVGV